ncbi:MAG: Crp/Fnr family transcriptional regulator [Gemmatimonadaceae bacterium]|nr:Crp/Fnr family transcriptional regulator [Gemmatimonadaceae bacterium]
MPSATFITERAEGHAQSSGAKGSIGSEAGRSGFTQNGLLRELSAESRASVAADLEIVDVPYRQVLYRPNDSPGFVYFPLSGVISILAVTSDSTGVEVASVGREGMANINLFLSVDRAQCEAVCQAPARVARLAGADLKKHTENGGELTQLLLRYTSAYLGQLSQSVACNRLHPLEERCARWLLMMQDRAGDQFPITHEFLSNMLGVRRATVTVAAGILQKAGLIRYTRGKMAVLDRAGLEAASCECYGTVRQMFERLVPAN